MRTEKCFGFTADGLDILVGVYQSPVDGAVIVEIDTPYEVVLSDNADGPCPLRIYLNDAAIYENPGFPGKDPRGSFPFPGREG